MKTAPLSYQQERFYLFEELGSGSTASTVAYTYWISGDLDTAALSGAVAELHRRHEILRTRYPDVSTQVVLPPQEAPLRHVDLGAHPDPDAEVGRLVDTAAERPFDLAADPPVTWTCYALGGDRHALTLH